MARVTAALQSLVVVDGSLGNVPEPLVQYTRQLAVHFRHRPGFERHLIRLDRLFKSILGSLRVRKVIPQEVTNV